MEKYLSDFLLLAGCALILYATYQINQLAAIYTAGGMCLCTGVLLDVGAWRKQK